MRKDKDRRINIKGIKEKHGKKRRRMPVCLFTKINAWIMFLLVKVKKAAERLTPYDSHMTVDVCSAHLLS